MASFELGGATTWAGTALADPNLGPGAKYVILTLAQFASPMGHMPWPSKGRLCDLMGINGNQLTKALKEARLAGYLRFVRSSDGEDNAYLPELPPAAASLVPGDGLRRSGVTHSITEYEDADKMWREVLLALSIDETILKAQEISEAPEPPKEEPGVCRKAKW